jgi:hypothetical protein
LSVTWIAAKARATAIVCGVALLLSGCSDWGDSVLTQKGQIAVSTSKPQEVYYPTPFASPPKLTLSPDTSLRSVAVVTQRPDGFIFKVDASQWSNGKLLWSAVGHNLRETYAKDSPGGAPRFSNLATVAGGRSVRASISGPATINTEGDTAIISTETHRFGVERERIMLDGTELVKLPAAAKAVVVTIQKDKLLIVRVDNNAIVTKQLAN